MNHISKLLFVLTILTLNGCSLFKSPTKSFRPEMIFIEGGTFLLGDFYEGNNTDALPIHEVEIESFYLGKHEITYEQYDAYATLNGIDLPEDDGNGRGNRAVVHVSWDEAVQFCNSLGYRLPSEVEWEFAARDRGKDILHAGINNTDSLMYYAAIRSSNINFSIPVGSFIPNELGLYDMSGNVFEWVDEFYQFYRDPENLHDHINDGIRIIRGGSFSERIDASRTYWRTGTLRDVKATDIGFRCAANK